MIHVWLINPQGSLRVFNDAGSSKKQSMPSSWVVVDSWQQLNELPFIQAGDTQICLYLATQSILTLPTSLSASQLKQLGASGQQYLFEEVSLTPVEQLQVRHMSAGSEQCLYALSDIATKRWQQVASLAGFDLVALLPDFLLLSTGPLQAGADARHEAVLYHDNIEQRLLLRRSIAQGMGVSHLALLPKVLNNIEEVYYIDGIEVDGVNVERIDSELGSSKSKRPLEGQVSVQTILDDLGIILTPVIDALTPVTTPLKHPLNFIKRQNQRLVSPYLALAASLLLLAGVVQMTADALQVFQYKQAVATTKAATNQQFMAWFNGERMNTRAGMGVEAQVRPFLVADQGDKQPQLTLLNRIAPLIKQASPSAPIYAESIGWQGDALQLVVKAPRRDVVDRLQQTFTTQGIDANLGAVNPVADGSVIATFTIQTNVSS